jgi:hypothetical protein
VNHSVDTPITPPRSLDGNGSSGTPRVALSRSQPYGDSIEHLRDEIARLDLLLKRAVLLAREPSNEATPEEFRGLVVTENEIDQILAANGLLGDRWERAEARKPELVRIDSELHRRREEIDARRELSLEKGIHLALPILAAHFHLSPAEVDVLLVALAPEMEPHYETLYAYLQNDVTRKHPSVNLALNLICFSEKEKLGARDIFSPSAPLIGDRLLSLGEESQDRQPSLLRKFLKLDENLVRFLLDRPPKAPAGSTLIVNFGVGEDLELEPSVRQRLKNLGSYLSGPRDETPIIQLIGESEPSLRDAAELLCSTLEKPMLLIDLAAIEGDESRLAGLMRDAILWNALLAVQNRETSGGDEASHKARQVEAFFWRQLRNFKQLALLLGSPAAFTQIPLDMAVWRIEVQRPDFAARHRAWQALLGERANQVDSARLADAFNFGGRRIRQVLGAAHGLAALQNGSSTEPTTQDLLAAGRSLTSPQVGRFAIRIEPRYGWNDIVLPAEKKSQLRRLQAWMRFRRRVHQEWGFGRKLSRGKGFNALFTGPSGTGKTMAAEILAHELSLELFQIDLSSVVSKYIGETEKNLSSIFSEAEQSQAVLFFDEADSLFGKRTEVKDAHDRYANIEVNYLLQRVEQYEGIVILATNLQKNVDAAFLRRMQEVVEFPFPDETFREKIWRAHFPVEAPRAEEIDFPFLARQFKLTGGEIKNVVLAAAFLAAQRPESSSIEMSDLILGTAAEVRKQGKLCTQSDFGIYYKVIQEKEALP